MTGKRLRVGVLFGGRSCEHEVSLESARSVLRAMDRQRYEAVPIAITKAGEWITMDVARLETERSACAGSGAMVSMLPDPERQGLVALDEPPINRATQHWLAHKLDVLFPLIHGPLGEDGTVQGLFELACVPYVGSGVLGSAVGMDKAMAKAVLAHHGLKVPPHRVVLRKKWQLDPVAVHRACELAFPYPWFVKPANLGSSVGVSKVHDGTEFTDAMELAARYDRKLIVECGIEGAREIEVSVLGNDEPEASVPGEIIPSNEFYDYESKYLDDNTDLVVPANLPAPLAERLKGFALKAFKILDCAGLARVDFLVRRSDHEVFVSEVNTLPGFTAVSMYPKLWEASGLPYASLIDRLIELALERHEDKGQNQTSYLAPTRRSGPTIKTS